MNKLAVVILAAGEGTRMKSGLPKVLHPLSGKPLVRWVLSAVNKLRPAAVYLVVGHGAGKVREELKGEKIVFVEQKKQLGSGHALAQAASRLQRFKGDILVLCGDTPLISAATLRSLLDAHRRDKNAATILSARVANPHGYGRICRLPSGGVSAIVEEKDAVSEQKKINEINSGIYCFRSPLIWQALKAIRPDNAKKEYYLTDAISILDSGNEQVGAQSSASADEIMGVNTRVDLAAAADVLRGKVLDQMMLSGVTIMHPASTFISPETKIGSDTLIYPGTIIEGATTVGKSCSVGPNSYIKDSVIGDFVEIRSSFIYSSSISDKAKIGPYSHLRPGTTLKEGARVGNFTEIKSSVVGAGSKVSHLTYIGDTEIGKAVNIGAGAITCNYDGAVKHKTRIDDGAFVGSNVNLVAPVTVGRGAILAAGSTITEDVPSRSLAIARARQINKQRKKRD